VYNIAAIAAQLENCIFLYILIHEQLLQFPAARAQTKATYL